MRYKKQALVIVSLVAFIFFIRCSKSFEVSENNGTAAADNQDAISLLNNGKQIFRFDTYGDE